MTKLEKAQRWSKVWKAYAKELRLEIKDLGGFDDNDVFTIIERVYEPLRDCQIHTGR